MSRSRGTSVAPWSATLLGGLVVAACGGDGMSGPIPPPPPPPPTPITLALGEVVVLDDPDEASGFRFEPASSAREYVVAVHSTSQAVGSFPLQLTAKGADAGGASASVVPVPSASRAVSLQALDPELARRIAGDLAHQKLRENMRRELRRVNPRPVSAVRPVRMGGGPAPSPSLGAASADPPSVGDQLRFNFAVDENLSVNCQNMNEVVSVVRAVGDRFVLAEDLQVDDGFSDQDWSELNALLDDITFPVDSAYWGAPADIDGNERVVILFTAEVNELTEPGSNTFIGGLFWPGDLATKEDCPASNEAEIVYLQAPDPNGDFSDPVSIESARRNARNTTAHEFQHLLTAEQRVLPERNFFVLEDAWLSEGFAHTAEEVVGLKVADLGTRTNLDFQRGVRASSETLEAFNIHHLNNYFRLGLHLEQPNTTQALGDGDGNDPGGTESLKMRGNAWMFLRWLADQYAPATPEGIVPGSAEELLFLELSTGGPQHLTGVANIVRAAQTVSGRSVTWDELLADYEAALAVDDDGPPELRPETQVLTWDLRDMFEGLSGTNLGDSPPFTRPYPLVPVEIAMSSGTNASRSFSLRAFTAQYFRFTSNGAPAPEITVRVTGSGGGSLPAGVGLQVTIARVE